MHGDTPQWEAPQILAIPEQVLLYKEKEGSSLSRQSRVIEG